MTTPKKIDINPAADVNQQPPQIQPISEITPPPPVRNTFRDIIIGLTSTCSATIVGGALIGDARRLRADYFTDTPRLHLNVLRADGQELAGAVIAGAGSATCAVGLGLLAVDGIKHGFEMVRGEGVVTNKVSVAPIVGPQSVGISLALRL